MKKALIFILSFIIYSQLFGQKYNQLLIDGNQWNTVYTAVTGLKCGKSALIDFDYKTEIIKISSDTILDNKKYMILNSSYDSLSTDWRILGFMREDTVSKKVFFRKPNDVEKIYYDFNLKQNDTITIDDIYHYYIVVELIDSIDISGKLHKRIKFFEGIEWIEGIGGTYGLLTSTHPMIPCGLNTDLLCFYNKDSLIYKSNLKGFDKCFYWESKTNDINSIDYKSQFKIFPNPVDDYLMIQSIRNDYFNIDIIDAQGQILLSEKKIDSNTKINIQKLRQGVCFVRISNDKEVCLYKLIKLNNK